MASAEDKLKDHEVSFVKGKAVLSEATLNILKYRFSPEEIKQALDRMTFEKLKIRLNDILEMGHNG